jgi:outer membrane protein insertion porin family
VARISVRSNSRVGRYEFADLSRIAWGPGFRGQSHRRRCGTCTQQRVSFSLYKFLDGVAFVDAGNVYPTLHDLSPFDVRPFSGLGVRILTPYLLLRFDYGINLKTKPGEPRGQFFFTFGQAF